MVERTFRISEEDYQALRICAKKSGVTIAQMIRIVIHSFVEEYEKVDGNIIKLVQSD